jgi:GTP cyclohydrolase II
MIKILRAALMTLLTAADGAGSAAALADFAQGPLSSSPKTRRRFVLPTRPLPYHMIGGGKEKDVAERNLIPTAPHGGGAPPEPGAGRILGRAITALRRGEPVLIRAPEAAVLALAAELAREDNLRRLREVSAGPACVVLTRRRAVALGLAPRAELSVSGALAIPIAPDLPAAVIRNLADPAASLGTEPPGLGPQPALAEGAAFAAVVLAKLAALLPAALVLRLGAAEAALAARRGDIAMVDAAAICRRNAASAELECVAEARVPLAEAEDARLIAFRPRDGGSEHLAILIGAPDPAAPVLVRLHSECFTGDLLASLRCDCGDQLRGAIAAIARAGGGALLYLAQEGRGIGLVNKLRAYRLQDAGFDTVDANEQLGFDADERVYLPAAEMLRQLGFGTVRLLTNNPDKVAALERYGIRVVERVPHVFPANGHNERYLRTKATRSGHFL